MQSCTRQLCLNLFRPSRALGTGEGWHRSLEDGAANIRCLGRINALEQGGHLGRHSAALHVGHECDEPRTPSCSRHCANCRVQSRGSCADDHGCCTDVQGTAFVMQRRMELATVARIGRSVTSAIEKRLIRSERRGLGVLVRSRSFARDDTSGFFQSSRRSVIRAYHINLLIGGDVADDRIRGMGSADHLRRRALYS